MLLFTNTTYGANPMTRLSAILYLLSMLLVGCGMSEEERQRLIDEEWEKERAEQEQEERRIEDERQQSISINTPKWEEFVDSALTGNGRRDFTFSTRKPSGAN